MTSGTAAPSPPEQQHTRHAGTGHPGTRHAGRKASAGGILPDRRRGVYSQNHKNRDKTTQRTQIQTVTKGAGGMRWGPAWVWAQREVLSVAAVSREIRHCKNASADSSPLIINELRFFLGSDFQSKMNTKRLFLRKIAILRWVGIKIPYQF